MPSTALSYRPALWPPQVRRKGLAIEKRQIFDKQDLLVGEQKLQFDLVYSRLFRDTGCLDLLTTVPVVIQPQ